MKEKIFIGKWLISIFIGLVAIVIGIVGFVINYMEMGIFFVGWYCHCFLVRCVCSAFFCF